MIFNLICFLRFVHDEYKDDLFFKKYFINQFCVSFSDGKTLRCYVCCWFRILWSRFSLRPLEILFQYLNFLFVMVNNMACIIFRVYVIIFSFSRCCKIYVFLTSSCSESLSFWFIGDDEPMEDSRSFVSSLFSFLQILELHLQSHLLWHQFLALFFL